MGRTVSTRQRLLAAKQWEDPVLQRQRRRDKEEEKRVRNEHSDWPITRPSTEPAPAPRHAPPVVAAAAPAPATQHA